MIPYFPCPWILYACTVVFVRPRGLNSKSYIIVGSSLFLRSTFQTLCHGSFYTAGCTFVTRMTIVYSLGSECTLFILESEKTASWTSIIQFVGDFLWSCRNVHISRALDVKSGVFSFQWFHKLQKPNYLESPGDGQFSRSLCRPNSPFVFLIRFPDPLHLPVLCSCSLRCPPFRPSIVHSPLSILFCDVGRLSDYIPKPPIGRVVAHDVNPRRPSNVVLWPKRAWEKGPYRYFGPIKVWILVFVDPTIHENLTNRILSRNQAIETLHSTTCDALSNHFLSKHGTNLETFLSTIYEDLADRFL